MTISFRLLKLLVAMLLPIYILSSCEDDRIYDPSFVGEGEATLNADITFTPLVGTLESRAVEGGTSGTALKHIDNLCIVFYKANEVGSEYAKSFYYDGGDLTIESTTNAPGDTPTANTPDNSRPNHKAESSTLKASLKDLRVPYGNYYIYAIANVDRSVLFTDNDVDKPTEILRDIEQLKKYRLKWDMENVAANDQMFGYFSTEDKSAGFDAERITINRPTSNLHAWIKRAASKVTVAFDGTGLKPGVEIFIKSVTIMDIPEYCYLGADNPGTAATEDASNPESNAGEIEIIRNTGQVMTYLPDGVKLDDISKDLYNESWPGLVSLKRPINGFDQSIVNGGEKDEEKLKLLHGENINALYFYENLQGKGKEGTPTDKRQQVNDAHKDGGVVSYPDGVDPSNIAWKDAKKYGTYIMVKAYYKSNNEKEGEGEITYRFMLGKDTKLDYNAERNHHYKLTLKFKGWANDVDWHIDYKKDPISPLRYPRPFFISYLYGHTAMIPVQFDAPEDVTITKVTAEIEENNWMPYTNQAYGWIPDKTLKNWTNPTRDEVLAVQPGSNLYDKFWRWVDFAKLKSEPWNGFLSLRKPKNLIMLPEPAPLPDYSEPSYLNHDHYYGERLNRREFSGDEVKVSDKPLYDAMDDDELHVAYDNGTYYVKVPIWTRARNMIKRTGYTGNNPYNAYYRLAKVKLKIELSNGHSLETFDIEDNPSGEDIEVLQVRRLVNPKGIYRRAENNKSFNVKLKVLENENATKFSDLVNYGGWRAYVIRDTEEASGGFVTLEGNNHTTDAEYTFTYSGETLTRKSIEGYPDSKVEFKVNFNGTCSTPRYAIIRVEYNYNSCYHLIFVRQGYDADDTFGDGRKWCIGNSISQNEVATNPLDEGSLFKFGNWNGIVSSVNVNGFGDKRMLTPNDFKSNEAGDKKLLLSNGETKAWGEITNKTLPRGQGGKAESFDAPGGGRRIATLEDFKSLVPPDLNDADAVALWPIKSGYGVCYGDGATETAEKVSDAFGHKGSGDDAMGIRGCFVYSTETGKNLFFPIGSSGYGHRKNSTDNGLSGVLRYSCNSRWGYYNGVTRKSSDDKSPDYNMAGGIYKFGLFDAPLFFDIFRSNGAIYWFDTSYWDKDPDSNNTLQPFPGWDINYSTFDFNKITATNLGNQAWGKDYFSSGSDACFIRCIEN